MVQSFSGMILCGEGELVKTFLTPGQTATGTEVFKIEQKETKITQPLNSQPVQRFFVKTWYATASHAL